MQTLLRKRWIFFVLTSLIHSIERTLLSRHKGVERIASSKVLPPVCAVAPGVLLRWKSNFVVRLFFKWWNNLSDCNSDQVFWNLVGHVIFTVLGPSGASCELLESGLSARGLKNLLGKDEQLRNDWFQFHNLSGRMWRSRVLYLEAVLSSLIGPLG